jgi:hypothetical protein
VWDLLGNDFTLIETMTAHKSTGTNKPRMIVVDIVIEYPNLLVSALFREMPAATFACICWP